MSYFPERFHPTFVLMPTRTTYRTLASGGLNHRHTALRLWRKAKRLGVWNPDAFDLSRDAEDWRRLAPPERDMLMQLAALFMAGEEAVTRDLLPLLRAVSEDGYLEDEIYLTSFLWEEAKHVDLFDRFFTEVVGGHEDLHHYQGDHYHRLFGEELPHAMGRLYVDASPEAQAEASVVYNMIVEGVLAETGYHSWYTILRRRGIMPGMLEGIEHVQRDEARHIRYGVYLLARLIAAHGEGVWQTIQAKMAELMPVAVGVFVEGFERLERVHGHIPFGLDPEEFAEYAMSQFQKRLARLEKARRQSLDEVLYREPAPDPDVQN